jgi:hypothetical protein
MLLPQSGGVNTETCPSDLFLKMVPFPTLGRDSRPPRTFPAISSLRVPSRNSRHWQAVKSEVTGKASPLIVGVASFSNARRMRRGGESWSIARTVMGSHADAMSLLFRTWEGDWPFISGRRGACPSLSRFAPLGIETGRRFSRIRQLPLPGGRGTRTALAEAAKRRPSLTQRSFKRRYATQ